MISNDEYLERVVAGIHAISSNDADVRWNEKINGRQFDVVVRFRLGTLNYLVLVEVKNRTRRASASDVEAFVTKARDQQASKAVFVTMAGFQEGAVSVAERHGVDLFKITFDSAAIALSATTTYFTHHNPDYVGDPTPTLTISEPTLTDVIEKVRLRYADARWFDVPSEASQMNYYAAQTQLEDGRVLGELMQTVPQRFLEEGRSRTETIELSPALEIIPPDEYHFPFGTLARIELTLVARMSRFLSGNIGIEPTSFSCPVIYTNVLTGEHTTYTLDQLPLNTAPLSAGKFYLQLHPMRYFHCAEVKNNKVTWHLIESFQHHQLIRSTYIQDEKYGAFYVPVSDKPTIKRLEGRLAEYLSPSRPPTPVEPSARALKRKRRPKALRGK
ncbi:restriction endonuclease [Croceibacterium sp. LX-88]|uniref:Restriction endonuclease n=1 Tax=Croceibacterium selenioxidans TaxID=2838833 RepID=A0ABS5W4H1_9SPHN|nr:restriction endonuclease [Croceibacterium selenioxidans]MBT2134643.1 restriction endonuclease [Croceibacterium selenioxidans]